MVIYVIERKYPNSERILELNHHFISEERDQNKSNDLYEELCILNDSLSNFNSILMESGKIYTVVNKYYKENRYDLSKIMYLIEKYISNYKDIKGIERFISTINNVYYKYTTYYMKKGINFKDIVLIESTIEGDDKINYTEELAEMYLKKYLETGEK